jgi:hypothetical protein
MKKLVGFAIAGAMVAGFQTAEAQPTIPSSGNTDLWLFVSNQTAGTTLAVDTGVTVSSLLSSYTNNAVLQAVNDSFSKTEAQLSSTGALATYLGSGTLEWAVEGVNWPTGLTSTGSSANQAAGGAVGILSAPAAAGSAVAGYGLSGLLTWASGFNKDQSYVINGNGGSVTGYTAGGTVYTFANGNNITGNVWGGTPGGVGAGSVTEYGTGPSQTGIAPGTSETLYAITGNNGTGTVQSYILGTLAFASGNLTLTAPTAPVPLPAAVWLFGSGLLGLVGVGRRRSIAAA